MNNDKTTHHRARFAATALFAITAAVTALPSTSFAQQGYTSKFVNLRAGPSRDYPLVVAVPAGVRLTVVGCLPDYRWCDVVIGANRGWMYAGNINYAYQGNQVPLLTYGPSIGIGVTVFSLDNYWDSYYSNYPWYPQRQYWSNRAPAYPYYAPNVIRRAPAQVNPVAPRAPQVQVRPPPRAPVVRENPTQRQLEERDPAGSRFP